MRISPQRHTLAVLRNVIGITQKELARLLECSTPTVQAVELGKLKLSHDLAQRINFQTAADTEWLLANDVTRPPVTGLGEPYTKALFENRQTALLAPKQSGTGALSDLWQMRTMFVKNVKLLAILYAEAYQRGKVPIAFYKSIMANKEILEKEIGEHPSIEKKLQALTYTEMGPVDIFELTTTLDEFEGETNEELRRKLKEAKEPMPEFLRPLLPGQIKRSAAARKKRG